MSVTAKLVHEGSGYAITDAEVMVDGKVICNATITFRVMDFPNPSFRAFMEEFAARIAFPMGAIAHA